MRTTTRRLARVTMRGGGAIVITALVLASSLQASPRFAAASVSEGLAPRHQQGNPSPRYPDLLRAAEVEGGVVVKFSTDSRGVPDVNTLDVERSTHDLFTNAVRNVLPSWHLAPNSSLQMPFIFVMVNQSAKDWTSNPALRRMFDDAAAARAVVITGVPGPVSDSRVEVREANPPARAPNDAAASSAGPPQRGVAVNGSTGQTYFEFQIEKRATPLSGTFTPKYPDALRAANVEGEVLAQFVVDADGVPDLPTFKVLKSSHELFTAAVRDALANTRFTPATVGGHAVRQLIQMPFTFSLPKNP